MKVVIIEDEMPAVQRLKKMLLDPTCNTYNIEIVQVLHSVKESLAWFGSNKQPDLVFMDIELSDGPSLSLLKMININCPVIFITAFDKYWQEAFEYNSIDYLLKPLKKERLDAALQKLSELKDYFMSRYADLADFNQNEQTYKEKFLVKRGKEYVSIPTSEIAFFYATHKLVCLVTKTSSRFILDSSLSDIEKQVDPAVFFRINRKYLMHAHSIKRIMSLQKSKLLIEAGIPTPDELVISAENSADFKAWLNK